MIKKHIIFIISCLALNIINIGLRANGDNREVIQAVVNELNDALHGREQDPNLQVDVSLTIKQIGATKMVLQSYLQQIPSSTPTPPPPPPPLPSSELLSYETRTVPEPGVSLAEMLRQGSKLTPVSQGEPKTEEPADPFMEELVARLQRRSRPTTPLPQKETPPPSPVIERKPTPEKQEPLVREQSKQEIKEEMQKIRTELSESPVPYQKYLKRCADEYLGYIDQNTTDHWKAKKTKGYIDVLKGLRSERDYDEFVRSQGRSYQQLIRAIEKFNASGEFTY